MPLFALLVTLFGLNQLALHTGYATPFTAFYLDDLLCLPIVLYLLQVIQRIRYGRTFTLPRSHILCSVIFFSVVFEAFLPALSSRYTGDLLDVALYFLGGGFFYSYHQYSLPLTPFTILGKRIKLNA